jgi:hypothetical protein
MPPTACPEHQSGRFRLFPLSVSPPERFSLLRGISRGGWLEAVGVRGPAGQETRGPYCEGEPRLGGVGEEHLGSAGQWDGLEGQVEVADDRVVDELDAGAVIWTSGAARRTRIRRVARQRPDEVREAQIVGVASASALSGATVSLATLFHAIDSPRLAR